MLLGLLVSNNIPKEGTEEDRHSASEPTERFGHERLGLSCRAVPLQILGKEEGLRGTYIYTYIYTWVLLGIYP